MDKIGAYTGPGKVSENVLKKPKMIVSANLFNYNTDGNMLKAEHKTWIDSKLIPLLRQFRAHVELTGTASLVGDRQYNRELSLERVLRVKKYLRTSGIPESQIPGPDIRAAGEDLSISRSNNDEVDRAVRIDVVMGTKPRPLFPTIVLDDIIITAQDPSARLPPPAAPLPSPPSSLPTSGAKFSQHFQIKQLSDGSLSVFKAIGVEGMFLLIRDVTNREEIVCIAPGVGTGIGGPISLTLEGPFNTFSTVAPQQLKDFEGRAIWQTLFSSGPVSKSRITFLDIPTGRSTKALTVPMDTGFTFGVTTFAPTAMRLFCSAPSAF